jgi:hypothetical protein
VPSLENLRGMVADIETIKGIRSCMFGSKTVSRDHPRHRIVPLLHPAIIAEGFLGLHKLAAEQGPLFPDIRIDLAAGAGN